MELKYKIIIGLVLAYLAIVLFMYIFQRTFLYFPHEDNYLTEEKILGSPQIVYIPTEDDITLYSWYYSSDSNSKTIVFFHGNAGTLNSRIYKLNYFREIGLNYLAITWRGFSGNDGKPTEDGLYKDARSAIEWLVEKGVDKKDIILYGESLGTGIAIEISQNELFAGLILESPYTSIVEMGKISFPYLPIKLILKDRYNSVDKLKNIQIPTLVLHGKNDSLVPFYMGKEIFENLSTVKFNYFVNDDDHMMRFDSSLKNTLHNFINGLN